MHRRSFLKALGHRATRRASLARPNIARAAGTKILKFIPQSDLAVLDPSGPRPTVHPQPRHDHLRHAVRHRQQVPGPAAMADACRTTRNGASPLRDGLKFHDGTPVLARDCVASIQRWGKRDAFGQAVMADTDELTAPDDKTHPVPHEAPPSRC